MKDHLKNGEWIERKYVREYDKSIWVNGKYNEGIRDGKWYYSPEGSVDKIEVYSSGIIKKILYP